jgi:hypothetical protein
VGARRESSGRSGRSLFGQLFQLAFDDEALQGDTDLRIARLAAAIVNDGENSYAAPQTTLDVGHSGISWGGVRLKAGLGHHNGCPRGRASGESSSNNPAKRYILRLAGLIIS